jgi:hypothetical protein
MKFKNTSTNSIILINEQTGINLKSVSERTVVYSIEFQVDLNEAAKKNNAFAGKVYFSKVARQVSQPIFSKDINGVEANVIRQAPRVRTTDGSQNLLTGNDRAFGNQVLIDEIKNINTSRRETVQRNNENILQTLNFSLYDFTSRENIERAKINNYSREENVLTSATVADLKNQPIFEQLPLNQTSTLTPAGQLSQGLTNEIITREMRNAITQNIDPASLVKRTGGIISAVKSLGGIASQTSVIMAGQSNAISLIQQALTTPTTLTTNSPINSTSFLTKKTTITTSRISINLDFEINATLLSGVSTIYFEIELNDDAQRPVYNKLITINHAKNLDEFLIPRFAPNITSFYRRGSDDKIVLFLKQVDPKATSILLYAKEFPSDNDYTQPYVFLRKVFITKKDNEKKVQISKVLNKRTIIRAIACSSEEQRGLPFSSISINPVTNNLINTKLISDPTIVWDYKFNIDNTITINGTIQFRDAVAIKITRKRNEETVEENIVYGPYFLNGEIDFSFIDTNIFTGETYIYNAYIISSDGMVRKSPENLIVSNPEIKNNQITTQITNFNNIINGDNLNVIFELRSDTTRENNALILENFRNQGIYDLYRDIFNVTDASNSYVYRVVRKNLTTGEEEDFGILQNTTFNDSFLRGNKNIKALQPGCSYKYSIYTYLRVADTLLPQLNLTGSYMNKSYTFKPYYMRNPFVLKSGTMVTDISLREQHTNSQYSFGPTGQIVEYNADFSNLLPTINNVIATNKSKNENILQWKVEGNLDKIDHFIILMQQLSARKVVGTVHNISETNLFTFFDILTDGESGDVEYVIIPVYFDLVLGQEVKSNTIII